MTVEEGVPLSTITTLRAGGPARFVAHIRSREDIEEALLLANTQGLPWYVLGEGSNVLAAEEGYPGIVLKMESMGINYKEHDAVVELEIQAGTPWEEVVKEAAHRNLWGIENLAGIPGTAGAAPIQNIGAYGSEIGDTLVHVDVYDSSEKRIVRLTKEECMLAYRDSVFKKRPELIVLSVTLGLTKEGSAHVRYPDLKRAVEEGEDLSSPLSVGNVVRTIRRAKFPDLSKEGTAGSFFKNPILTKEQYGALLSRYPEVPGFPHGDAVKVPLAYVLDKVLGLRGYAKGNARLFEAQPLVLVLSRDGSAGDVEALAHDVAVRVYDVTGIHIEREVQSLHA